jgi:DNA-binding NarL/FixJ family response regulator
MRIVLVERRPLARAALDAAQADRDVHVVAQAGDVATCLAAVGEHSIDLVLVDARAAAAEAAATCRTLRDDLPEMRTVVLVAGSDVASILIQLEAGAHGIVIAEDGLDSLLDAMVTVSSGHSYLPTRLLGTVLQSLIARRRADDAARTRYGTLSQRERETLALLGNGDDAAAIADHLVISTQTARTHIQNVLRKLEVHSRLEAASFAVKHGFTELIGDPS